MLTPPALRPARLVLAAVLALAVAACGPGGASPGTAATVNGDVVPISQVEERYDTFSQNPQIAEQLAADEDGQLEAQLEAEILTGLIRSRLVEQGAAELGVDVSEEDVEQQRAELVEQVGGEEQFQAILEQNNLSEDDVRSQLREVALQEEVARELTTDAEVGDAEVADYYDTHYGTAEARHILLESEEEAQDVLAELGAGEDFGELARERSIDPSAEDNEGDLGEFSRGDMVPEFSDAVFDAEEGQVIGPVESDFGWHVIEVQSVDEGPPLDEVEGEIRDDLLEAERGQAVQEWLNERAAEAEVEVNPRFGEWDPELGQVVPEDPLGPVEEPQDQPPPGADPAPAPAPDEDDAPADDTPDEDDPGDDAPADDGADDAGAETEQE